MTLRQRAGHPVFLGLKNNRLYLGIHYDRALFEPGIVSTTSLESIQEITTGPAQSSPTACRCRSSSRWPSLRRALSRRCARYARFPPPSISVHWRRSSPERRASNRSTRSWPTTRFRGSPAPRCSPVFCRSGGSHGSVASRSRRDAVHISRGLRPWPRRYPRPPYGRVVRLDKAVYIGKDGSTGLINPSASPILQSEDEARWVAAEMRRAMQ